MATQRRATAKSRRLVLIVEDDSYTRQIYAQWLAFSGLRVAEAAAAEDAIEKARQLRPDLITTEIQFEDDKGGLKLCAELKKSAETKSIPIIAVTEWEMGDCVEKARRAGCDLVLVKPCLPQTLLAEVQRLLNLPITRPKPRAVRRP